MSTNYSENILNLVQKDYVPPLKEPMYKSNFNPEKSFPGSTFGCTGSTHIIGSGKVEKKDHTLFGPQTNVKPLPKSPLNRKTEKRERTISKLPPVPTRDVEPVTGLLSNKNFVMINAVEAILKEPKKPKPELDYLRKEDFGKVPAYLDTIKKEIVREKQLMTSYLQKQQESPNDSSENLEELPQEERVCLLRALKAKWDKFNGEYQKITHIVNLDTIGKIRRKEVLENHLKTIEADITRLERAEKIMIKND